MDSVRPNVLPHASTLPLTTSTFFLPLCISPLLGIFHIYIHHISACNLLPLQQTIESTHAFTKMIVFLEDDQMISLEWSGTLHSQIK